MGRFLLVTTAIPAHTANARPFATGLLAAGHQVSWSTSTELSPLAATTGARLHLRPAPAPALPLGSSSGVRAATRLYESLLRPVQEQVDALVALCRTERPQVLLGDSLSFAGASAAEITGLPWASFGDGPLHFPDVDTPPFGSGLPYRLGLPWQARNESARRVSDAMFASAGRQYATARHRLGLPTRRVRLIEAALSHQLHLHGSTPGFEYPRRRLPPQVRWVGSLRSGGQRQPPPWWDDLLAWRGPVVAVTQGSVRHDPRELLEPATRVLPSEGYFVVALGGRRADSGSESIIIGPGRLVSAPFVPYDQLFPHIDALVTNGGWSGVTTALAHGVPVVQVGRSEEKADIGARIVWSGAGLRLGRHRTNPTELARATRRVLQEKPFRAAAARLAGELAELDAATDGAAHLTDLLESSTS